MLYNADRRHNQDNGEPDYDKSCEIERKVDSHGREINKTKCPNIQGENLDDESEELEEGELLSPSSESLHDCRRKSSVWDCYSENSSYRDYANADIPKSECSNFSDSNCDKETIRTLRSLPSGFNNCKYINLKKFPGVPSISDYKTFKKIGEGSFGEVIIATNTKKCKRVALKKVIVHKDTDGVPITTLREIMILKSLDHENIIKLKNVCLSHGSKKDFTPGIIYMVFPYMEHDLAGLLYNPDVYLNPAQIKCYTKQLLEGIAYLHKKSIMHRDMKSANVLVGESGILKIADFGLARYYDEKLDSTELTPTVITVWYRPPELLLGSKVYTTAVDMWGIGSVHL